MGVRIRLKHLPYDRSKIQVGQIIKLLIQHINGEREMQPTQIKAAEILLKKALPDLTATEISHQHEVVRYYAELPNKDATVNDWAKRIADRANVGVEPITIEHKPQKSAVS